MAQGYLVSLGNAQLNSGDGISGYLVTFNSQTNLGNGSWTWSGTTAGGGTVTNQTANGVYYLGTDGSVYFVPNAGPVGSISTASAATAPAFNDSTFGTNANDAAINGNGDQDYIYGGTSTSTTGTGNDTINAGAGNDVVYGGDGNDLIRGGGNNDTIYGGTGNDTIYGDDQTTPTGSVEHLSWSTFGGNNTNIANGFTQDTGNMRVTFAYNNDGRGTTAVVNTGATQYVAPGESFSSTGSAAISGSGLGATSTSTFSFDAEPGSNFADDVLNVQFRLADVDTGGWVDIITIRAYDSNGNVVSVTIENNGNDTVSGNTITSGPGNDTAASQSGSVLVTIPGPVHYVEVVYSNGGSAGQVILISDVYFTTMPASDGNDFIDGGDGDDTIYGGGGNDSILGGLGRDTIYGGTGNDAIDAGDGNDLVYGDAGNDTIIYGTGNDVVYGGDGDDIIDDIAGTSTTGSNTLYGDAGNDTIWGAQGNDVIYGGTGNDVVSGDAGDDTVYGDAGNDIVNGDAGNDTLYGGSGDDTVYGGDGNDVIGNWSIDDSGNDTMYGGNGNDSIVGGAGNDTVYGDAGDDTLSGQTGDDTLYGGDGQDLFLITEDHNGDIIFGGEGGVDNDTVMLGNWVTTQGVNVTFTGAEAGTYNYIGGGAAGTFSQIENIVTTAYDDTINASANTGAESIYSGAGNDSITGGSGNELIDAGTGNDTINAGAGNDTVYGGAGNDSIIGGAGNDIIDAGTGNDIVGLGDGFGIDTIIGGEDAGNGDVDYLDGSSLTQNATLTFTGAEAGTLVSGANSATFSQFELFSTGSGNDTINAANAGGNVTVSSGAGNDTITGGIGNDSFDAGSGNDTVYGGAGNDKIDGGLGDDTLYGGTGSDSINGGAGNDLINGGAGADTLIGGGGTDTLDYSTDTAGVQVNIGTNTAAGGEAAGDVISGFTNLTGGTGSDTLTLSNTSGTATGGLGFDTIYGGSGNDVLFGGAAGDTLYGGAGNDTIYGGDDSDRIVLQSGFGNDIIFGGEGGSDYDILDATGLTATTVTFSGNEAGTLTNGTNTAIFSEIERLQTGAGNDTINAAADTWGTSIDAGAGNDTITGGSGNDTLNGGLGDDTIYGGAGNDIIDGGAGNDLIRGGAGADTLTGGGGTDTLDYSTDTAGVQVNIGSNTASGGEAAGDVISGFTNLNGGTGSDTLTLSNTSGTAFGGAGNDTINGGNGNDILNGDAGNDTLFGGAGNDALYGGTGDDTLRGGLGDDTLYGGAGNDYLDTDLFGAGTVYGGDDADTINIGDNHGAGTIFGGEGGLDQDKIQFNNYGGTSGVNLTFTGNEAGSYAFGTATGTFVEIEQVQGSGYSDTINAAATTAGVSVDAGAGNDVIIGGAGNDTINAGTGADTVTGGAGNDIIDLGADSAVDTVVLADGSGADRITNFTAPTPLGGGAFAGNDQLNVAGLHDLNGLPVNTNDVVVSNDGFGNAVLTFPNGESITLVGVAPSAVTGHAALHAMGIPLSDGTVEGTAGGDLINGSYLGDPDGDQVDNNDALLPGSSGNDDLIYAYGGNDTVQAGNGNDTVFGGTGNDTLFGGAGNDLIHGDDGNDTIGSWNTGPTNGTETGNDTLYGDAGNDTVLGGDGNDTIYGGTGDDVLAGQGGNNTLFGGDGQDLFVVGPFGGTDQIVGGEGGIDNDRLVFGDTYGNGVSVTFTGAEAGSYGYIDGGATGSFAEIEQVQTTGQNDTVNASAATGGINVNTGGGNDVIIGGSGNDTIVAGTGADTVTGGAGNDVIDLGAGAPDGQADVVVLQNGFGHDIISSFDAPTANGNGTFTGIDTLNVTALTNGTRPVNVNDVTVTNDGSGNAVLTFPNGESVTLIGISPTAANNPLYLNAIGIPLSDGTVEGTAGSDLIDGSYTGDPDGDRVDDNDAILPGDTGNDDLIYGYGGNDTIVAGDGNDEAYGGTGDDTLFGGAGTDTLFGDAGNDTLYGGAGADLLYGGADADTFVETDGFGADTIVGGETGIDQDIVDLTGLSAAVTVTFSGSEAGSLTNGTDTATFSEIEQFNLTAQSDTFNASAASSGVTVFAGAGNDSIRGGSGNDYIDAGSGNDTINAGAGNDTIHAGTGSDTVLLGNGFGIDTIIGGEDPSTFDVDTLDAGALTTDAALTFTGTEAGTLSSAGSVASFSEFELYVTGSGNDTVNATAATGGVTVFTGAGNDTLTGGAGDDSFSAGSGNDTLFGGAGNDTLYGGSGNDTLDGGTGNDMLDGGTGSDTFTLADGFGTDTIYAGEDAGNTDLDLLDASALTQNATLTFTGTETGSLTSAGNSATFQQVEVFATGSGNDTVDASAATGGVRVSTGAGNDTITGGSGNDSFDAGSGNDWVFGGAGNDTIFGGSGADLIEGGAGDNTIYGGDDNDRILVNQDDGTNTIFGGEGGQDNDLLILDSSGQSVNVTLTGDEAGGYSYGGTPSNGTFAQIEEFQLSKSADTFDGSASSASMTVSGDGGNDSLLGGSGADTLYGGSGDDTLSGGTGADLLDGGTGNDTITFAEGDMAYGGSGDDLFVLQDLGETTNGTITIDGGNGDETGGDTLKLGHLGILTKAVRDTFVDDGTGSFSGSITLDDGTILNFSEIENIICFTPGTRIATPRGARPIETLRVGDMVVTRDHGLQPIRWIQSRTVPALDRFAPVRIRPGVVTGLDRDLLVSPQHRMLFTGYRAELLFGESEVLVSAKHLIDGFAVTREAGGMVTYIHMMFDEHEVVYAEGAATESFHPGEVGLSAVTDAAREELFALFPALRSGPNAYGDTARRVLKKHEAQLLRV